MADKIEVSWSKNWIQDRVICYRYDAKRSLRLAILFFLGRKNPTIGKIGGLTLRQLKNIILKENLAVSGKNPSWFYTAFERGTQDPLTNFEFDWIQKNLSLDSRILNTGCGTGIMAFELENFGFKNIVGFDLLEEAIRVAKKIGLRSKSTSTNFYVTDGLNNPVIEGKYDLIMAVHWLFSAWMGNYGNDSFDPVQSWSPLFRQEKFQEFLSIYVPHLNEKGYLMIEVTDAVTDYRLENDHPEGAVAQQIYPVRLTPEQVQVAAEKYGLSIEVKKLCVSYGHHPRTCYILQKI